MHMADALLSAPVSAILWGTSVGSMAYAVKKINKNDDFEQKIPLMAVSGAFVFAAQMINFTIPSTGSSGHIGGGILLAALLGEFPALLTIAAVLFIQCLFFADGGLLALGANIFNMGVIPCLVVYPLLFKPLLKNGFTTKKLSAVTIIAAIVSLQLGAFGVVLETLLSGITELPFGTFVLLMQPIHLAIGAVEGFITAAVLAFVYGIRPEIIKTALNNDKIRFSAKKVIIILAILALVTGGAFSRLASSYPDGLEWSIENIIGSDELKTDSKLHSSFGKIQESIAFMPDYDFAAGNGNGTSAAGVLGAFITAVIAFVLGGIVNFTKVQNRKRN